MAKDAGASASDRRTPTCYNCHKTGHISTFCPEPERDRKVSANVATSHDAPVYVSVPAPAALVAVQLAYDERVDENEVINVGHHQMDLPLYHVLTQVREHKEVFAFSTPTYDTLRTPTSVMHSFTHSPGGQDLFTIWDTAALLSMVPLSTVRALNLSYTPGSDLSFMVANGSRMSPIGYCSDMSFSFPDDSRNRTFSDKVYIVESAPFQLLLGIRFLHRHWADMFLPWARIVLMKPDRLEIQGSLVRPASAPLLRSGSQQYRGAWHKTTLRSELEDDLRLADVLKTQFLAPWHPSGLL